MNILLNIPILQSKTFDLPAGLLESPAFFLPFFSY